MFKKFFDLDKNTVEDWILNDYRSHYGSGERIDKDNLYLVINYFPFDDEIRVNEHLKLDNGYWENDYRDTFAIKERKSL